jgi:ketosteroid isomerase-like protein
VASANLELVRSIYSDWERGDFSSAAWAHPEIEWTWIGGPSPRAVHGLPGLAEGTREWLMVWNDARMLAEHYIEIDQDRIAALVHFAGHGKASGLDLAQTGGRSLHLWQLRAGKVTELRFYWDRDQGLTELGLPR